MNALHKLIPLFACISMAACQEVRTVKVTVVGEDDNPIEEAQTTVTFLGHHAGQTQRTRGLTNGQGVFEARGEAVLRMSVRIEKEGYYPTQSGRLSRKEDHNLRLVLREIKNPIPLYAKRVSLKVPVLGEACGFDFAVGDWTKPHGTGKSAMCFFEMGCNVISPDEHEQSLVVTFPGQGDGIVAIDSRGEWKESEFQWCYRAPEVGYAENLSYLRKKMPGEGVTLESGQRSHAMRVNATLDQDGKVLTANYVRLEPGISLFGVRSDSPGFKMTYYYNPTPNDRNLEFDPKRNLFKDLDSTERVSDP